MAEKDCASNICEAVNILIKRAMEQASFNNTIVGTIEECEDATIGKYKIKHQDSVFSAYSVDSNTQYSDGTLVYISVPNGDMSETKLILSSMSRQSSDFDNSTYSIDFDFSNSNTEDEDIDIAYDGTTSDQITIVATPTVEGTPISTDEQTLEYFWFIEDATIQNSSDNGYLDYAGAGWRCLNTSTQQYDSDKNLVSVYPSETNTFKVGMNVRFSGYNEDGTPLYENPVGLFRTTAATFLCCAVFADGTICKNVFDLKNSKAQYTIDLTSSMGINFYYTDNLTDITCTVTRTSDNTELEYSEYDLEWYIDGEAITRKDEINDDETIEESVESYVNLLYRLQLTPAYFENDKKYTTSTGSALKNLFENDNKIIYKNYLYRVPVDDNINISCKVSIEGEEIGTAQISLTHYETSDKYSSAAMISGGDRTFIYDKYGDLKGNNEITLSVKVFDDSGYDVSYKIDSELISWVVPEEDTMISSFEVSDGKLQLSVNKKFKKDCENNTIKAVVNYKGSAEDSESLFLVAETDLTFVPAAYSRTTKATSSHSGNSLIAYLVEDGVQTKTSNVTWTEVARGTTGTSYWACDGSALTQTTNTTSTSSDQFRGVIEDDDRILVVYEPVEYINNQSSYTINVTYGVKEIVYSSDGRNPIYEQKPFNIRIFNGTEDITESLVYSWTCDEGGSFKNETIQYGFLDFESQEEDLRNEGYYIPPHTWDGNGANQFLDCAITDTSGTAIANIHFPIVYRMDNIDYLKDVEYYGKDIKIGESNDDEPVEIRLQTLRTGLGNLDSDSTGVFLGEASDNVGLQSFAKGKRTSLINSSNGSFRFNSKDDTSEIVYDTEDVNNNAGTSFSIDLGHRTISHGGDGKFNVDKDGYVAVGSYLSDKDSLLVTNDEASGSGLATLNKKVKYLTKELNIGLLNSSLIGDSPTASIGVWGWSGDDGINLISAKDSSGHYTGRLSCSITGDATLGDDYIPISEGVTGKLLCEGEEINHYLLFKHGMFVGWEKTSDGTEDDDEISNEGDSASQDKTKKSKSSSSSSSSDSSEESDS